MSSLAIIGTIVDATDDWKLRIIENCLMVIDHSGKIVQKCENTNENIQNAKERLFYLRIFNFSFEIVNIAIKMRYLFSHFRYNLEECNIVTLENEDEFLLPGFIDSHIHAAQFPNAGKKYLFTIAGKVSIYIRCISCDSISFS